MTKTFLKFFLDFRLKFIEKCLERRKKVENSWKRGFGHFLGARSTRKLVEIRNKRPIKQEVEFITPQTTSPNYVKQLFRAASKNSLCHANF